MQGNVSSLLAPCSSPGARRGAPNDDRADRQRPLYDHRHQAGLPRARRVTGDDLPPPAATRAAATTTPGTVAKGAVGPEREAVLAELHSERFVDSAPAQVWATLLDESR